MSEARPLGDFGQRQITILYKIDSSIDPPTQDELMDRQAHCFAKGGREGSPRHPSDFGQMIDRYTILKLGIDLGEHVVKPSGR